MGSMQCYTPSEEMYYEKQQYTAHAQTGACDAAGFQLGVHGQLGLTHGHYMGFGQQMGHRVHAPGHKMGHGMGMQTPGYQMGHQFGLMRHHKQDYGQEMGFGHGGQVLGAGGQAKHHEFDGMVYYRKSEKKIEEKKKCKRKKEKHSHKKKDHGSGSGGSSSSSDSD